MRVSCYDNNILDEVLCQQSTRRWKPANTEEVIVKAKSSIIYYKCFKIKKKRLTALLMPAKIFPLNSNNEYTAPFTSLLEICINLPVNKQISIDLTRQPQSQTELMWVLERSESVTTTRRK